MLYLFKTRQARRMKALMLEKFGTVLITNAISAQKCKNEPSLTYMRQIVLEISHPKVRNLSKMDVAIL